MRHSNTRRLVGLLGLILALVVSACGSSGDTASTGSASDTTASEATATQAAGESGAEASSADLRDALPEAYRKSGVLKVGTTIGFPPYEFFADDGKTMIGYEPDIFNEVGKRLGVKMEYLNGPFAGLFPGLKSERFDFGMLGIVDTAEREKANDYVSYIRDSTSFIVGKGNPSGIKTLEDLCGKSVAALLGASTEQFVTDYNAKNCGANKIKISGFEGDTQALLQVRVGRADAFVAQTISLEYYAEQSPDTYEIVPDLRFNEVRVGIAVSKKNRELSEALRKAIQSMIDDGSYEEILKKWSLEDLAVDKAEINYATKVAQEG